MSPAELIHHESPSDELEVVVGAVSESVRNFTRTFLARISSQAANGGKNADPEVQAGMVQTQFARLANYLYLRRDEDPLAVQYFCSRVPAWITLMEELRTAFDEAEHLYIASPREIRRAHASGFKKQQRAVEAAEKLKFMMIDFLESVDPTPDGYLEDEIRKIHGVDGDSVISGFAELSASENFSLEAFMHRHNLK